MNPTSAFSRSLMLAICASLTFTPLAWSDDLATDPAADPAAPPATSGMMDEGASPPSADPGLGAAETDSAAPALVEEKPLPRKSKAKIKKAAKKKKAAAKHAKNKKNAKKNKKKNKKRNT